MIGSKIKVALTAVVMLVFSASCGGSDGKNATIKTVIDGDPVTLDPQTSLSDSSVGIIANVFSGLFAFDEGGAIVPDMAEEYTVSEDGLVWEFKLKENVMWYDGEDFSAPCTANDYVFAFRRLINPATKSRRAAEYFCIKNAERLNKKIISELSMLGVEAIDDHRLRITLEEPRSDFKAKLAAAPAMPCCEEFFNSTEGRYGLSEDCLASNGSFCLYSWRYDKWSSDGNYIVLRRNKLNNTDENDITPYGLTFFIGTDGCEAFKNGEIQCYAAKNEEECIKLNGYSFKEYEAGSCGIIFNCGGVFANNSLRTCLGASVAKQLKAGEREVSAALMPETAMIDGINYRQAAGMPETTSYLASDLSDRYIEAVAEVGADKMSGLKLIILKNSDMREYIGSVLQGWQRDYGFYCSVNEYDSAEYLSALRSGSFDIAAVRLSGSSAVAYLDSFSVGSSINFYGIKNRKLEHIIKSAGSSVDADKTVMYCKEAEQMILDMYYFVPVMLGRGKVFFAEGVSGVGYDPHNEAFIFKNALRVK